MAMLSNPMTRLRILPSIRVPIAVVAIPQSAYRTFMRMSKCTLVRLHAICEHEDASDVRDGHLCDEVRVYKYVIDDRINWKSRIPFASLMLRQIKK